MPSSIRICCGKPGRSQLSLEADSEIEQLMHDFEQDRQDSVHGYLRARRSDAYLLMPERAMAPANTRVEVLRELAHIIRPVVYSAGYVMAKDRSMRWGAFGASLVLEMFASWPELVSLVASGKKRVAGQAASCSPLEEGESHRRLWHLVLFALREPFYGSFTRDRLNSLKETLGEWRLLRPFIQTATTYQKLWETVHFYTSSS